MSDQNHPDPVSLFPVETEHWPRQTELREAQSDDLDREASHSEVRDYCQRFEWTWPSQTIYFFCDLHADADAFKRSLLASGGIEQTGAGETDFALTSKGREAVFIIGGDCFDKGPSNLQLLDLLKALYDKQARIELLAGNHDIRTYLGIICAENKHPLLDHLFVRMGRKTVPFLKEIHDRFIDSTISEVGLDETAIRAALYPADSWYDVYPEVADGRLPPKKITKEVRRVREKILAFEKRLKEVGMSLADAYAAVKKFRELFLEPAGHYRWFFDRMKLAHREGAFLFVHGGLDDEIAQLLQTGGVEAINERFASMIGDKPFEVYHGVLGNVIRTKYRDTDADLTPLGVDALHASGIHAIVHGHRNLLAGQRLTFREGVLNLECDATVNRNSRIDEGLKGPGGAVLIISPERKVFGVSTDYPFIKLFQPES